MAVAEFLIIAAVIAAAAAFVTFTPGLAEDLLTAREWAFRIGGALLALILLATNHTTLAALIIFFGAVWFFYERPYEESD